MVAFRGVALPSNVEIVQAIRETQALGEPTIKLATIVLKLARNEFQTKWRKNHDYFEMERMGEDMIQHAAMNCLQNATRMQLELSQDGYGYMMVTINCSFTGYVHKEQREEHERYTAAPEYV